MVHLSPKTSVGWKSWGPPGVQALVPVAIQSDFLMPFKEAHWASGGVSAAAFQFTHMEPIACHFAGERLPAWQGGGLKIVGRSSSASAVAVSFHLL